MNINVSLMVQSLKLHQLRQSKQAFLETEHFLDEEKEVQICRKALSDFRKQLRFFLHKGNIRSFEEDRAAPREILSGATLAGNNDDRSPSEVLDVAEEGSERRRGEPRTVGQFFNRDGPHSNHRLKRTPEKLDSLVNGVGLTPIQKEALRYRQLSDKETELARETGMSTIDSLRVRAQRKCLPAFSESQLSALSEPSRQSNNFSFRSPGGAFSFNGLSGNGISPSLVRPGNQRNSLSKSTGEPVMEPEERYRFADPSSGASSSFVQRLAELYTLQAETVRYERLKAAKRKAKQA